MNKIKTPRTTAATVAGDKLEQARQALDKKNTLHSPVCQSTAAQRQRILKWLTENGPLTTFDSREKLLVPHPAGRINELRKLGFEITTERCWEYSAGGSRHLVARYSFKREEAM